MMKMEKTKVPNKGVFEKGYALKFEDRLVPDYEAREFETERMREWQRRRILRETIND